MTAEQTFDNFINNPALFMYFSKYELFSFDKIIDGITYNPIKNANNPNISNRGG